MLRRLSSDSVRFLMVSPARSPWTRVLIDILNRSIHIHSRVLWNSCIKIFLFLFFFASPLSVISVPHQPPLNAPWFRMCSNLKPLSSKGHMPCLSFGAAWDCLPVSSFWGALWGLLCLIYATWTTMELQRRIPSLWSLPHAGSILPSPRGPG